MNPDDAVDLEGWIAVKWGLNKNERRARYYRPTAAGKRRLHAEEKKWNQFAEVIASILNAVPEQL